MRSIVESVKVDIVNCRVGREDFRGVSLTTDFEELVLKNVDVELEKVVGISEERDRVCWSMG
jgi:hypothetical protein